MQNYTQEEKSMDFPLQEEIFSVRDLNRLSKSILEQHFSGVWVKGEISNLAKPRSGHIYFTLKDADAQIRCAMFKYQLKGIDFDIQDGLEVLLQGTVSIYTDRGDYQLIASKMLVWGQGQLQQAFEALKVKLSEAGLFDPRHKKAIPSFPNRIGIISSASGDALQDILRILKERYPIVPITVYPTEVQGKQSAPSLIKALKLANRHNQADVLILARGGGSLEDLWGFNEEILARAVFDSTIPIVTGIGHEMDFTIADFVADLRAPTPTAAAQACVPDGAELLATFKEQKRTLTKTLLRHLDYQQFRLDQLQKQLIHPRHTLTQNLERLNHLKAKLKSQIKNQIVIAESNSNQLKAQLFAHSPEVTINYTKQHYQQLHNRLKRASLQQLAYHDHLFKQLVEKLHALSPLSTLSRGYAIVSNIEGQPVKKALDVQVGDSINTRLQDGHIISTVDKVHTEQ